MPALPLQSRLRAALAPVALALLALAGPALAACGESEEACSIAEGTYHIVLPPDAAAPIPVVMFLHGFGSSGTGTLSNTGMTTALLERGYAVIAPDGLDRGDGRTGWSFIPQRPAMRDEPAFFAAILADAAERFGIDPGRSILGGFSIGGSMASYTACAHPEAFTAYAPVSGSFWRPHPEGCKGPVRLLHTHGWTDGTVPLEGRPLRGDIVQGDVFQAMQIWRAANGCDGLRADEFVAEFPFLRRRWTRCAPGSALELALFPGGHSIPAGWSDLMLDWFEGLPPPA